MHRETPRFVLCQKHGQLARRDRRRDRRRGLIRHYSCDAVRRIEAKNAFVAQELARWRDLAVSTDATSA